MDIFLIIISGVLLIAGFLGCILPILPGVPLSYIGLLLLHFTHKVQFSAEFLIFWAIIVIVISIADYVIPIWGTKKFGGSKKGVWGSTIGLIFGFFLGPFGIIFGPFFGALVGELLDNKSQKDALRAAFGSFIGFIIGTISKLIIAGFLIYHYIEALI
jgi:uncharacterized protein YqgC (DUF456 family)